MPVRTKSELPPSSWAANPGYEMLFQPLATRVRVEYAGRVIAESSDPRVMHELGHAPVYYLPGRDVFLAFLIPTDHHSHCPYKGDASYWSVNIDGSVLENAVWAYEEPYEEMSELKDWMGFYWDRFEWFEDGEAVDAPREADGRINHTNNFTALYPELAADWHPEKNRRIKPYEFAPDSDVKVWWRSVDNDEWEESIRTRVARYRQS